MDTVQITTRFNWSDEKASENSGYSYTGKFEDGYDVETFPVCAVDHVGFKRKQVKVNVYRYGLLNRVFYCANNTLAYRLNQVGFNPDKITWSSKQVEIELTKGMFLKPVFYPITYIVVFHDDNNDALLILAGNDYKNITSTVKSTVLYPYTMLNLIRSTDKDIYDKLLSDVALSSAKIRDNWYRCDEAVVSYLTNFTNLHNNTDLSAV